MVIKSVTQNRPRKINDLLLPVPKELWLPSSLDIEIFKMATPIKGTVDNSKPLADI